MGENVTSTSASGAENEGGVTSADDRLMRERALWLSQSNGAPNFGCAKDQILALVSELLRQLDGSEEPDPDTVPELGARYSPQTWKRYSYALAALGVVERNNKKLSLTPAGREYLQHSEPSQLVKPLARRVRLVAETLDSLAGEAKTIDELHGDLVNRYRLDWKTDSSTRARVTLLEAFGLVEWLGDRKVGVTSAGREKLADLALVSPEALRSHILDGPTVLPPAPSAIQSLLDRLLEEPGAQEARSTYNIWVPSPPDQPNKVENLRTVVGALDVPLSKDSLAAFIEERFALKRSSVDSMFPFLKAAGLIREVQRGVFARTPAATAWLETGHDVDLIRILHANVRFVGELVDAAEDSVSRSVMYERAQEYGLNREKTRWLIAILTDAGLLYATSASGIQSSSTGALLAESLPLADPIETSSSEERDHLGAVPLADTSAVNPAGSLAEGLIRASTDPAAEDMASGGAFESYIERCFRFMGFKAQKISGSGDTDVLVEWIDDSGAPQTAIVDGKSTSSGRISHTNVSELALDSHKDKNSADFVALVAPSFGGDTIRKMAAKHGWALITASELAQVVEAHASLGIPAHEIAQLFDPTAGLSRLLETIEARRREFDLVKLVVARLKREQRGDEPFSPRDVALIERQSDLAPNTDEVLMAFEHLEALAPGSVLKVQEAPDSRFSTYTYGDPIGAARRLRALAKVLEDGASAN